MKSAWLAPAATATASTPRSRSAETTLKDRAITTSGSSQTITNAASKLPTDSRSGFPGSLRARKWCGPRAVTTYHDGSRSPWPIASAPSGAGGSTAGSLSTL
jgi:hypothetical protein